MAEGKLGKIGQPLFDETIVGLCGHDRPEVRFGPAFGVDVGLVDLPGGYAMALASDPLSLIPSLGLEASAWLSVHLMANDIATTGRAPMYGQFVLNLPAAMSHADFKRYWEFIHRFCKDIGVSITGGHTGFAESEGSTIAGGGTLITIAPRDLLLTSASARPGDSILVTKQCALSSAAILAMSFPDTVRNRLGQEVFEQACESFYHTSSLADALCVIGDRKPDGHGVHAMHDVTEGGVLGAIYELAAASGNGVSIDNDKLPISLLQQEVCQLFGLDHRRSIGAGAMIVACRPDAATDLIERLRHEEIACTEVGRLTAPAEGLWLWEGGEKFPLVYEATDPYWAAYFTAKKEGWK